jgi:hypothetical protein
VAVPLLLNAAKTSKTCPAPIVVLVAGSSQNEAVLPEPELELLPLLQLNTTSATIMLTVASAIFVLIPVFPLRLFCLDHPLMKWLNLLGCP